MLKRKYCTFCIQTSTIEYATVEKQVMEGLKAGNKTLTDLQKEMNLDDVQKLMSSTNEAIAYQNVKQYPD